MSKEIICAECGQYESDCKCPVVPPPPNEVTKTSEECMLAAEQIHFGHTHNSPPVAEDVRAKIMAILFDFGARTQRGEIADCVGIANDILALLKEAGYVKLAGGKQNDSKC